MVADTGNICQLRCPLCPTGQHQHKHVGLLKYEVFEHVLKQIGKYLVEIELYNWGEPLLNPDLVKMIRLARSYGIRVVSSTNLNTLSPELAEELATSGLDELLISIDGATQETYEKYRVGGNLQQVLDNLELLKSANERSNTPIRLVWRTLLFSHNEHEIPRLREMAADAGVDFELVHPRTDMGREIFEDPETAIRRDGKWLPREVEHIGYDLSRSDRRKPMACLRPWFEITLNWDGSILPCCHIYDEAHAYGHSQEETLDAIWGGSCYRSARADITRDAGTIPTVCKLCKSHGFHHF